VAPEDGEAIPATGSGEGGTSVLAGQGKPSNMAVADGATDGRPASTDDGVGVPWATAPVQDITSQATSEAAEGRRDLSADDQHT